MTNVVNSAAAVGGQVSDAFSREFSRGRDFVDQLCAWFSDKGVDFLMNVVAAVLILILGGIAVKVITAVVRKALRKTGKVNELLEKFLCSVVSKTGWIFLVVIALGKLGVNVGPLVAGLGVTGFILGFAFQETLGNFASGIMIAVNQPFKVGDYVIAGGVEGSVLELNMMAAVLATADNKRITVPNKSIWGGAITNFSALGKRRVDTVIGISYGSDIDKAVDVALEAVKAVPGVLAEPAPGVAVGSLDSSAITINVRPWSSCADYWAVYSGTQKAVKEAFDRAGITIPFPQMDVHVTQG